MDRPADNRGAHAAPSAGLDSQQADDRERYTFIPLNQISLDLQHAVIAAEDTNFSPITMDSTGSKSKSPRKTIWKASALARASTITQQLVKNLFFGTSRSFLRKGEEATLVPVAELVLGKQRHSGDLP